MTTKFNNNTRKHPIDVLARGLIACLKNSSDLNDDCSFIQLKTGAYQGQLAQVLRILSHVFTNLNLDKFDSIDIMEKTELIAQLLIYKNQTDKANSNLVLNLTEYRDYVAKLPIKTKCSVHWRSAWIGAIGSIITVGTFKWLYLKITL